MPPWFVFAFAMLAFIVASRRLGGSRLGHTEPCCSLGPSRCPAVSRAACGMKARNSEKLFVFKSVDASFIFQRKDKPLSGQSSERFGLSKEIGRMRLLLIQTYPLRDQKILFLLCPGLVSGWACRATFPAAGAPRH